MFADRLSECLAGLGVVGRELVDGRPTIVVEFAPRPGYKPVTEGGKVIQKFSGRAWVDEADRQLVRLEAQLVETLGVGPARIARLQKGASAYFVSGAVVYRDGLPTGALPGRLVRGAQVAGHGAARA